MPAKNSNWLPSLIVLCWSFLPWALVNVSGEINKYCESLPDEPANMVTSERRLKRQLEEFEKENYSDFHRATWYEYDDFCDIFMTEPPRPKQILAAYWLKFDGYDHKIKQIHDTTMNDSKHLSASSRESCKLAIKKMEAIRIQRARDIHYLVDNVSYSFRFQNINHKLSFYFIADSGQ